MFVKKVVLEGIELAWLLMRDICVSWCRETRISEAVLGPGMGVYITVSGRMIYVARDVLCQYNISICQFYEQ